MAQPFQATYDHGVLRLDQPLPLPDQSRVSGTVFPNSAALSEPDTKLTVDEFERMLAALSGNSPVLPLDFSRADVYSDHD